MEQELADPGAGEPWDPAQTQDYAADGTSFGEYPADAGGFVGEYPEQEAFPPEEAQGQEGAGAMPDWLGNADREALEEAWNDAEAEAIAWAEGQQPPRWQDTTGSTMSRKRKAKKRRPEWNQAFAVTNDSRFPPPLRRYFDPVPGETSAVLCPKKEARRHATRMAEQKQKMKAEVCPPGAIEGRKDWQYNWALTASVDNNILHKNLRHYFDQRGLESSFRNRPHIDCDWLRGHRSSQPAQPDRREKLMKWTASAPSLSMTAPEPGAKAPEPPKAITWGDRCMKYGSEKQVQQPRGSEKIPWVRDHGVSETEDNDILHPSLRHLFVADGLESSFRNRGRGYGRPVRAVLNGTCGGFHPGASSSGIRKPSNSTTSSYGASLEPSPVSTGGEWLPPAVPAGTRGAHRG